MKEEKNQQYILQSVDKALSIIDLLCEYESLSAQEVAQLSGIGKSTAFRLLTTLENRGFLRKDPSARYSLGVKFFSIKMLMTDRRELAGIMHPFLVELNEQTRETCHLSMLTENAEALFLDNLPGKAQVRVSSAVGQSRPLYAIASGKAMLAFQPRSFVRNYAEHVVFEPRTIKTIKNVATLYQQLNEIRETGYAYDDEEFELGLTCFSAPILNSKQEAIAAFCVSGPTARMRQNQEHCIAALKQAAADASKAVITSANA